MDNTFTIHFNSDIAKDNTEIRISFYSNIGFFIELAQMLEFNLRKLLCYELSVKEIDQAELNKERVTSICDKYDTYYDKTYKDKWTLGTLYKELNKVSSLQNGVKDIIKEITEYRAMLVHKIFQNNVVSNNLSSAKTVQNYIDKRLIPMINKTTEINKLIIKIIELYRDDLHSYKKQIGIEIPK